MSSSPSIKFDTFDTFDTNDNVIRDFSGINEKIKTVLSLYEKQEQLLDGKAKHLLPQNFLLLPTTRAKPVYEYGDNERWSRLMFQAVIMKSYRGQLAGESKPVYVPKKLWPNAPSRRLSFRLREKKKIYFDFFLAFLSVLLPPFFPPPPQLLALELFEAFLDEELVFSSRRQRSQQQ
ncbi:hypothetical protein BGZ80_009493 [Entomortierella chlamydospora]|uniref:Uncharacterized protein n=1 Tax=Entomortierella chlamydospora TaxID=101097 RepID=A0A9P6T120_9FUNG|nr:hypothetical protein BGZ80_009493 [Entomortierella chlamydospora]